MGFFFRTFMKGAVLSSFCWLSFNLLNYLDVNRVVHNNVPGSCQLIEGIKYGSEDLDVLPNGIVLHSTGLGFNQHYKDAGFPSEGALMTYNIAKPEEPARKLQIKNFKGTLNPHGLSILLQGGNTYVYLVNHPPFNEHPPADTVEKFLLDVENGILTHQKTFSDPEFIGINDLVVVDTDKFYISNYQAMRSKLLREMQLVLYFLPLQNVVYYDGQKGTVVLPGMYGPNGVDVSPDKKYLYVSEVHKKRVNSFRIVSPTELVHHDTIYVGSAPDNINVNAQTGDLWIGSHSDMFRLMIKMNNPLATSPSQVLRLTTKDGKFVASREFYSNDGSVLSGSSSAAYHQGLKTIVIGTIDQKAMVCKCETCDV